LPDASCTDVCAGAPIPPAAHAAASMFATGATRSARSTRVVIYSSFRRASNSRLIAEMFASKARTDCVNATRSPTKGANACGT
jgi:hypothetical protein